MKAVVADARSQIDMIKDRERMDVQHVVEMVVRAMLHLLEWQSDTVDEKRENREWHGKPKPGVERLVRENPCQQQFRYVPGATMPNSR